FKGDHGADFISIREFFTSMVNAETNLTEITRFIADWRVVTGERSVTEPQRWNEIVRSYQAAQRALTEQANSWRHQAREQLEEVERNLAERVHAVGVPEEQMAAEVATLSHLIDDIRQRLAQTETTFYE